ncbi:MAG: hypothetical protein HWN66_03190 [Candidatus Helarchaeota archaeon]|nr:hypothetical protein [Candidatus Helarchaeota archaeon]
MTDSQLFKIGSSILLIVNVVLILFGCIYAIRAELMPYHIEFIGASTYDTIANNYPNVLILSQLMIMLVGFLFLSIGTVYTFIWYYSFRKGEKWAWLAILVSGALILIPLMYVILIVAGFGFPFPVGCVSLILWVVAMAFTAKEALGTE